MIRRLQPIVTTTQLKVTAVAVALVVHLLLWLVVANIGITEVSPPIRTTFVAVMLKPGESVQQRFSLPAEPSTEYVSVTNATEQPTAAPTAQPSPQPTLPPSASPRTAAIAPSTQQDNPSLQSPNNQLANSATSSAINASSRVVNSPARATNKQTFNSTSRSKDAVHTSAGMVSSGLATPLNTKATATTTAKSTLSLPKADLNELANEITQANLKSEQQQFTTASEMAWVASQLKNNASRPSIEGRSKPNDTATTISSNDSSEASSSYDSADNTNYDNNNKNSIYKVWTLPIVESPTKPGKVRITLAPSGAVLAIVVISSSGSAAVDASIITAVKRASPLSVPSDKELFERNFRSIIITFDPQKK